MSMMRWMVAFVILTLSLCAMLVSVARIFFPPASHSTSGSRAVRDELEELLYEGPELNFFYENETFDMNITTDAPTEMPFLLIDVSTTGLPLCNGNELVLFDGDAGVLFCATIPDRDCRCPGPEPGVEVTPEPNLPPTGCTVFQPPKGGAFVCLSTEGIQIYCSVLCDDQSEFSTFPLNPYTCGAFTKFKWVDSTNRTRNVLPDCFGVRQSLRPLHFSENYLPTACNDLSDEEIEQIKSNFCNNILQYFTFSFDSCSTEDVVLECADD